MAFLASAVLFLVQPILWGQTISLPAEVRGQPGVFLVIRAQTDGTQVQWHACTDGLSIIPPDLLRDSKSCVAMAGVPGRYTLMAWTAKGNVPSPAAECVVIVGEPGPDPPKPGPNPPKPDPVDPLTAVFQGVYDSEKDPASLQKIIDLFMAASLQVMGDSVKTTGQMNAALASARKTAVGEALPKTRDAIAKHLVSALGEDNVPYTVELRKSHSEVFEKVGKALKGVKP